ncbi:MAG: hypothetical protein Q8M16_16220 [Pirellulaceae bacterium]|nr:hypothetical protein [Pirellulaceae bacterium]
MSTSKPKTTSNDPAHPSPTRVTNKVPPGAPGVSLEETVESNVETFVKEYGPPVVTAILVVVLAASGWAFYVSRQESIVSNQWDALNVGANAKNAANLQGTADSARGTLVGAVATNLAGMAELNAALEKMVRDPEKAKTEIKTSMDRFKQVVDYPHATDLIKQQAKYALAFAHESLGEFDLALPLYQELAALENNPIERFAKDGAQRCQDPAIRAFQEKFATWKPANFGTAPNFDLSNPSLDLNQLLNLDSLPPVPTKTDPAQDDSLKLDPPKSDPSALDPPKLDPPVLDPPKLDPPVQDPPKLDPPVQEPPVSDLPKQ